MGHNVTKAVIEDLVSDFGMNSTDSEVCSSPFSSSLLPPSLFLYLVDSTNIYLLSSFPSFPFCFLFLRIACIYRYYSQDAVQEEREYL